MVLILLSILIATTGRDTGAWINFAALSLGIAVLASVAGNALGNRMSGLLPFSLIDQMILFETVFALLYAFAWAQRWPTLLEIAAPVFVTLSVMTCLAAHRRPPAVERAT